MMSLSWLATATPLASGSAAALSLSAPGAVSAVQVADTVINVAARDGFDLVYGIAAGGFVVLLLVLVAILLGVIVQIRNGIRTLDRARAQFFRDEAVANLRKTTGHVESMARSLMDETERMSASLARVSDQVTLASRRMEERIEEFNALMEVVQEEAEDVFVDTAASARGVRKGLGELTDLARSRRSSRPAAASPPPLFPVADPPRPSGPPTPAVPPEVPAAAPPAVPPHPSDPSS